MKNYTLNKMENLKSKLGRLGMFAMTLGLSAFSFGQTITTSVATGTGTTVYLPIYGNYGYSYSQQIYLATDFNTAVAGQPSLITKIRLYNVTGSVQNSSDWVVYMGNTAQAAFGGLNASNWVPQASLTQVYSGVLATPTANAWQEIVLATPFTWDGTSNVVVAIDENTASWSAGDITWRNQSTGNNRSMLYYNDNTNPNPASLPNGTSRYGYVPQMQFVHAPTVACSGTPAHTTATVDDADLCLTGEVTFGLEDAFVSGLSYQWQKNDGSGWVDFTETGSDAGSFTTTIDQTMNVRAQVTCISSAMEDISEEVTVNVHTLPTVAVNLSSYAICDGSSAALIASGAATYSWSPATGLDNAATAMVQANPTTATVYTVTGTSADGCTNTATTKVYPITQVKGNSTFAPAENCTPGTPVTVTVSGLPAGISGSGTWEYRFLANDGVTVAQDWSAASTFTFTPDADSLYNYFYQIRSTSCNTVDIDSVGISIPVGFGGETDLIHYDCNTLSGTITLANTFGQTEVQEIYANDFTDPANVAGITFTGSAAIVDGRAVITPSVTSNQNSSMMVEMPGFAAGANNSMTVSFLLTADQPIDAFGTGGADGLSYSFGNDAVYSTGNLQDGKGTKLRLVFDANDNYPNAAGIYLVYGYTGTGAIAPNSAGVLAFVANIASWKLKMDTPVELAISAEGKATVTVDGTVIFTDIQMPAAYMNSDVSAWKHLFSAQTGGDAMRHAVADFSITAGSLNYGITAGTGTALPTEWQTTKVFDSLTPGTYNVWLTQNTTGTCNRKIATIEILNLNPVVNLGNDTTICAGESLVLDAENPGAIYVWSGTNIVTQTLEVDEAGSYVVYATDTSGCLGIGTINVTVAEAPTATGIYVQGDYPTVFFAVTNPENVSGYNWNFGDGTTAVNAPSGVSHTYAEDGTYSVTVQISNDCGDETLTQSVTIHNTASIAENTISGLKVYPNPVSDQVTISLEGNNEASATIYSVSGSKLYETSVFQSQTKIDVRNWEKGVYFVHISSEGKTSISKIIVQ